MCVSLFELSSYVQIVGVGGGGSLGSLCVYHYLNYPHMSRLWGWGGGSLGSLCVYHYLNYPHMSRLGH